MNVLISVIVPIYNCEEYLNQCVESICNQDYRNLEIILVDDGSTDGSGKLCEDWKDKDSRIIVINKENGGQQDARTTGIKAAKGEYIGFVDSDDWIEPDMYSSLLRQIGDCDIATSGVYEHSMSLGKINTCHDILMPNVYLTGEKDSIMDSFLF